MHARPARRRRCAAPPTASRPRSPGLEEPLGRYLLELEADMAEGRSWYGEPGAGELVDWQPVLDRAGVAVSPQRVAQAYLELAVLVRALEGLVGGAVAASSPTARSLWAGLFDLRENLFARALDDLRALAASPWPSSSPSSGRSTSTSSRAASGCRGPGETLAGATFERHPGGKGANQAVAAARLGAEVRMVGAVGDDALADDALAGLARGRRRARRSSAWTSRPASR